MKEVPVVDVFDGTDFNPELILSSVFLDANFDFVPCIDELDDNVAAADLMQQIGSSAFYDESSTNNAGSISRAAEEHQQTIHSHIQQQQQQPQQHLQSQQATTTTSSRQRTLVENNQQKLNNEVCNDPFGNDLVKQLTGAALPPSMAQMIQQQQQLITLVPQTPLQQQQPCKCEFCEYLQANRISLTGDHSFQCEFCGEGFSTQSSFNRHRCGSTDIQVYRCDSCRREYGSSRTMSTINTFEPRDKCDICNRNYVQSLPEEQVSGAPVANSATDTGSLATGIPLIVPPHGIGSNKPCNAMPLASIASPAGTLGEMANGCSSDLGTIGTRPIPSGPTEHDISAIESFVSDSECIGDFCGNESLSLGVPGMTHYAMKTMELASNRTMNTTSLHPEPAKTYFVLGNVELQQFQSAAMSPPAVNPAAVNNISNTSGSMSSNGFYRLHASQHTSYHHHHHPQQQPVLVPSVLNHQTPKEHEVTSLQQYDQYDDEDYSTMSEDEAIVPIVNMITSSVPQLLIGIFQLQEPYAKSPKQDQAKTELPIQDTIVDTSTKASIPAKTSFPGGLAQGLEQQAQLRMPLVVHSNTMSPANDDDEGKCDSSSSVTHSSFCIGSEFHEASSTNRPNSYASVDRPYKCHICDRSYRNQKNLKSHLKVHEGIRAYQCEICGKNFSGSSYLVIHRRRHTGERPFKCTTCGKAFVDSRALAVHTRLHSGERLKCEKCEKTFSSVSALTVHNRLHTGIHPYKCEICSKTFPQYNNLKHHMKKHEAGLEKSTPGGICTNSTSSISSVGSDPAAAAELLESGVAGTVAPSSTGQMVPSSTTNTFDFKCQICSKLYKCSSELQEHLRQHGRDRPNQCEFCSKVFPRSSHLIIHRRRHTGERPFKCKYCDKAFVDSRALSVHTRLHTGERVKCEICEKTFASSSGLIVHRRIHTGVHPYKCDYCEKSFAQSTALKYHLKKHDIASLPTTTTTTTTGIDAAAAKSSSRQSSANEAAPASGNDRYKCLTCGKVFRSSEYLVRHRRTHSGERPHQCEICSKHFSTMSYLVIHRRRHTSERPYKCTSCEKAFVDSRALQEHARLHTGDRVKCEICQKTYSSISNLIVHRRIHSGIHPFECSSCGKSFAQKNALKYHLKKHVKLNGPEADAFANDTKTRNGDASPKPLNAL
ncbi:zinc finger protein 808-like [Anopheles cruzii]|uniref:zinc finger protein 808-like n=1 Tax=Anopheles cruzii TaxID=68878 RepID=UPI0022EC1974|nr:zinc finger protein 808-like [Anopheles cruzii]